MGGRGGTGRQTVSYYSQTEKAVKLKIIVDDFDTEQTKSRIVWVPKSQLTNDGKPSLWITEQKAQEFYSSRRATGNYEVKWEDAKGRSFNAAPTRNELEKAQHRQERFNAGAKAYNDLVAEAKALGIKGIRAGMRRKTIEDKIRKHKSK